MAVAKITEKLASSLQAGETVWDSTVKGFGIRRQKKACVYVLKYRDGPKQRFFTIGRHGSPWTTEHARNAAKEHLYGVWRDRDVVTNCDKQFPTFAEFAERYMAKHAAAHKKPRSLNEDRRNLDLHILPSLGDLKLNNMARREVAEFHHAGSARPVNANRCLALISHIFTIAAKWEVLPAGTNPCRGLDRYPERPRERLLDREELKRLGNILRRNSGFELGRAVTTPKDWRGAACVKLLILTGARLGEILGLQWSWINWERGYARLPDSKTGPKTIPLPLAALELLGTIKDGHAVLQSKFVLPGSRADRHFKGIQRQWQLIRGAAGLGELRVHDLRHCYASFAVAGGESLYVLGSILGHHSPATTQRYAHLALEPILLAANRTADRLSILLDPLRTAHNPAGPVLKLQGDSLGLASDV
jgi:integrase